MRETYVKQCIETAFSKKLTNLSIEIVGNSNKGDGFSGDIVFATVTGLDSITNQQKQYPLVLKCSKDNETFRKTIPIQDAYLREITFYENIVPAFQQFQQSKKSIRKIFDAVPKFYASFTTPTSEIIILENLKKNGYDLWDTKKSLTLEHILMVAETYGHFHSISLAMRDQKPEDFQKLTENLIDTMKNFAKVANFAKTAKNSISQAVEMLKDYCDENVLDTFNKFKDQADFIFDGMRDQGDVKIICHGDCWTNNFMWKHNDQNKPEKVAIIDWQGPSLLSPAFDLSYFTFSCISSEDLENFNIILDAYYNSLSKSLIELGSDPNKLYPKEMFLGDWKKFARFGFTMCLIAIKMAYCNKEDLPDLAEESDKGTDFADVFMLPMKDLDGYKQRIKPIIEYAVKNHLLD